MYDYKQFDYVNIKTMFMVYRFKILAINVCFKNIGLSSYGIIVCYIVYNILLTNCAQKPLKTSTFATVKIQMKYWHNAAFHQGLLCLLR